MTDLHGLDSDGAALWARVDALIARGIDTPAPRPAYESLALEIARYQRSRCTPLDRAMRAMGSAEHPHSLDQLFGLPTDAFKTARIAAFPQERETRYFHTSGTTREVRGRHAFSSLALYEHAAIAAGKRWLLPKRRYRFILLAEREVDAPHSSLSYMLARFHEQWSDGAADPWMIDHASLDLARLSDALEQARAGDVPVALLGATFAFVHAIDGISATKLPRGSVVMPTGGFKGRSRELAPNELFDAIRAAFGVERADIVQEYGMTELSSQAYEAHADGVAAGRYVAPPWMLVDAVDPVTLRPLSQGEQGLLRIIDLANIGSSVAIQTADLGVVHHDGFEVLGRAPGATPRGCARAIDALLTNAS